MNSETLDRYRPVTVAQMIEIDRFTVEVHGIPLLQMMENVGRGLAAVARRLLGGRVAGRRVVVLVGSGDNGGGGLVAARHLVNAGAAVVVALVRARLRGVPVQQRRALVRMGVPGRRRATLVSELASIISSADLILDALIGYGLTGAPREPTAGFIRSPIEPTH